MKKSPLNSAQREAVRYIDGPLLVLAGAGSGKTRVIAEKVAYLIEQCGYDARNIAAVTFTNKAAREMKDRVARLLGSNDSEGLRVSTFHSLGLQIIRSELAGAGLKPGFSIFDAHDSGAVVRDLLLKGGFDDALEREMVRRISSWKSGLTSPDEAQTTAADQGAVVAAQLYERYQHHLRVYNAVDFDDLIALPVQLLEANSALLERWQNRLRYLLIDEYQDTNATQYRLVTALVGIAGRFTAVGDDDQSIYAWRGAQPENLALLQGDFPGLRVVKLEQNYRSTSRILRVANHLIAHNPHLFEKRLWSEGGEGELIRVVQLADEEQEATRVVAEIIQHRFKSRSRYSDFAILYRGNHQSLPLEKALRNQQIPYQLSGGTSFFSHSEVRDLIAYLRLLVNHDDDNAFLRVVNTPRRGIGASTLEQLGDYASGRGISLHRACGEMGLRGRLTERALARLDSFVELLESLGAPTLQASPSQLLEQLLQQTGYREWLLESSKDSRRAARRQANIDELVGWLSRLADGEGVAGLDDLVSKIALMDMLDRKESSDESDQVRLMTLHAAKGLEFPYVFLVGMEEELLPHRASIEEGTVEEERRIAYVGITRAEKALMLTLVRRRKRGGERVHCEGSRFLQELPQEDLQWEGVGVAVSEEQRVERGKAHLAALKGLLNSSG